MNKVELKVNRSMNGVHAGSVIKIEVSRGGIPIDPFWRKRVRDSKRDNCVEVIKETETKPKPSKE